MTGAGDPLSFADSLHMIDTAGDEHSIEAARIAFYGRRFKFVENPGEQAHHFEFRAQVARLRSAVPEPDPWDMHQRDFRATVVPATWVTELSDTLRTRNPRLRLATVRCHGRPANHTVLRIYGTDIGPVAVFNGFQPPSGPYHDDAADHDGASDTFPYAPAPVRHPAAPSALPLRLQPRADATFGAECRCSRQWLTVTAAHLAITLASDRPNRTVPLRVLHDAEWRHRTRAVQT